jgi:hypothetical protein
MLLTCFVVRGFFRLEKRIPYSVSPRNPLAKPEIRKLWTACMFLRINSHALLLSSQHKFAFNLSRVTNICKVFLKGEVCVTKGYISTE